MLGRDHQHLNDGALSALIIGGDLRSLRLGQTEVLRAIGYPVRDASWGTIAVRTTGETRDASSYARSFAALSGEFDGRFSVTLTATDQGQATVVAEISLRAHTDLTVNRAGFTLLHPITGVSGTALIVTHPDGTRTSTRFPDAISPGQPAKNIVGLLHEIGPVVIDIAMHGEVFEMEDQRNWSDASFKSYCRPLALPRPYVISSGSEVYQTLRLCLTAKPSVTTKPGVSAVQSGMIPSVLVVHEDGLTELEGIVLPHGAGLLARVSGRTDIAGLTSWHPQALEIIFTDLDDLSAIIRRCNSAGLHPTSVVALPAPYLASHQPEGPWPAGPQPADAVALLRKGFADALIGAGSLTNFTEFNRCRPDPSTCDFGTFGNTAIVHAADDLSVTQTLEAIPHILASAHAILPGKPLHLGLMSIGMRSNPYGKAVLANPTLGRIPMAMDDPRQTLPYAAAYATGILAACIAGRVDSVALAMVSGPLGAAGTPLGRVIAGAAVLSGERAQVMSETGLIRIESSRGGIVANLSDEARPCLTHGLRLTAAGPQPAGRGTPLAPTEVLLWGDAA